MVTSLLPILDPHDVALHGAWSSESSPAPGPTLLQRTDENFLATLLAELQSANPGPAVRAARPRPQEAGKSLRLFQPVHRVFNLALVEAHCETHGTPRLDPRKIDSTGMVVRRIAIDAATGQQKRDSQGRLIYEGWMADQGRVVGWSELLPGAAADADPDPTRHTPSRLTEDPLFDLEFRGPARTLAEESTPMFVAPPEAAARSGRTLIYGVIPVTSSSRAGTPAGGPELSLADWQEHLTILLKASSARSLDIPASGVFTAADLKDYAGGQFMTTFRQLAQEFRLFDADRGPSAQLVLSELNQLSITLPDGSTRPLGAYLEAVARVLRDEDPAAPTVLRPKTWPSISSEQAKRLHELLRATTVELLRSLIAPAAGRYDDLTRQYAVRAFVRVKCERGCPAKVVWSDYSEAFVIAAWFDPGPVAPVQIPLPDPFDREFLKKARPGVAFAVPARLAGFLNQDPKELVKGGGGTGGLSLDWICGFNIPIITLCAFIVLSIFLSLFDLIFRWLLFVKICIPFPRKK